MTTPLSNSELRKKIKDVGSFKYGARRTVMPEDCVDNLMQLIDQYTQSKLKAFAEDVEKAIGEDEYPEQHFPTVLQGENIEKFDKVTARDRLRAELRKSLKAIKGKAGIK